MLKKSIMIIITLLFVVSVTVFAHAETITVAVQAGAPEPAIYKSFTEEFTKNTGINIEWVEIPQEQQHDKLTIELMSGSGTYDVVAVDHTWVSEFASNGFLKPLDDFLGSDKKDFYDTMLNTMSYQGNLYAVPQYGTVEIMYYRTDLFEKYGLREPTLEKPLTWDEYLQAAEAITEGEKDNNPKIWGTIVEGKRFIVPAMRFIGFLHQAGTSVIAEDNSVNLDSQAAIDTLQFLVDLIHKYKVAPEGAASFDHVDNHTMFMQGRLGFAVNWQYAYSLMNENEKSKVTGKFQVALPPKKEKSTAMVGAWGLAIPKGSKNVEDAKKLISFLTSKEQLYRLRKQSFGPVVRKSEVALLDSDPDISEESMNVFEVMNKAVEQGTVIPRTPKWSQIVEHVARALSNAVTLDQSPEKSLEKAAEDIRRLLNK